MTWAGPKLKARMSLHTVTQNCLLWELGATNLFQHDNDPGQKSQLHEDMFLQGSVEDFNLFNLCMQKMSASLKTQCTTGAEGLQSRRRHSGGG